MIEPNIDVMQHQIGKWADETFPDFDPLRFFDHFESEVAELREEFLRKHQVYDAIKEETADCAMFLLRIAQMYGFSLGLAVQQKHEKNLARTWNTITPEGFTKHDEPDGGEGS